MKQSSKEIMMSAVADWRQRGLIDGALQSSLAARYDTPNSFTKALLQWLGLGAIFLLSLGILGLISMLARSPGFTAVLMGIGAVATWQVGVKMATDPLNRHAASGTALVTISLVLAMGCMTLASITWTGQKDPPISPILFATAALSIGAAYWYRLRWPFLLGLLCLFHAVGSGHYYAGHGSYFFNIQDPRLMAPVAAFVMLLGVVHERYEEHKLAPWSGFGRLCVIFGLLYFNCSLWIPSIKQGWSGVDQSLPWVIAFTAAAIGEIILGARLADAKFTGFGVVFLSINLYTRLFENFWDKLSMGLLLLVAGLIGLALGVLFEFLGGQRGNAA